MADDLETLSQRFRHFANVSARGYCRLYEELARAVAEDRELLALAGKSAEGQPPVNMLFAAVRYLCLGGADAELQGIYEQAGRQGGDLWSDGVWRAFRSFCRAHEEDLAHLIATRRTQTNEVGRGAIFYPAFAHASARTGGGPLGMLDIGTSAGLTLGWDRFRYRYLLADGSRIERGDPESSVEVVCELSGVSIPLPERPVPMGERLGIDLHPVDVRDEDQARWLRALLWPDRLERIARLENAIELARVDPPQIRAGNAAELLPEVLADWPPEEVPCITHTLALYQFDAADVERVETALLEASRERTVLRMAFEEHPEGDCVLELLTYRSGERSLERLGMGHGHARWLQWSAPPVGARR